MHSVLSPSSPLPTLSPQLMSLTTDCRRYVRRIFRRRTKQSKHPFPIFGLLLIVFILFFVRSPSVGTLSDHLPVIARDYLQQQSASTMFTDDFIPFTTPPLSSLAFRSPFSKKSNLQSRVDAIVKHTSNPHIQLKSVYLLPSQVVDFMPTSLAERLYWKLVYVDVVNALGATANTNRNQSTTTFHTTARVLFIHTQNGLGNRLRSLASGLAMARATKRVPVVVWEQDPHLGARFSDLFVNSASGSDQSALLYKDLLVMETFPKWSHVHQKTRHWFPVNYMEKDGLSARSGILMRFSTTTNFPASFNFKDSIAIYHDMHVYFKSAYIAHTSPPHLSQRRYINKELMGLRPTKPVLKIFSTIDHSRLKKSIGIHIRSRSLSNDNVQVSTKCEYSTEGAAMTDYWRARSQLPVFVEKMKSAIRRDNNISFFVAVDDVSVIKHLQEIFPKRIQYIPRNCDDRNGSCVIYAMADLMCLARTRKIYGSRWSSFTEAAARLGNKPVYLSGFHFGVQRAWPRTVRYWSAKLELRIRQFWFGSTPLQDCIERR